MDIRAASFAAAAVPVQSGRSGSQESAAQARKSAADSAVERKEAEGAAASRSERRVDIRA